MYKRQVETIGKRNSCTIDTHYLKQREALNTALPIGVRPVSYTHLDVYKRQIPGNCDTFIYLGGNEQSTHKYVSELLGKGTIDKKSSGDTKGRQGSSSRNYDVLGRELFTPYEVRKLDNKKCIIFIRGFDPIMDNKFIPFNHPMFNQTADGKGEPYVHQTVLLRETTSVLC